MSPVWSLMNSSSTNSSSGANELWLELSNFTDWSFAQQDFIPSVFSNRLVLGDADATVYGSANKIEIRPELEQ